MTRIGNNPSVSSQQRIGNPPPRQQEGDKVQTVKKGDTLSHIARENNVSTRDLVQANPQIQNPDRIWPGDQVRIPGGSSEPAETPRQTPVSPHQNDTYSTEPSPNQSFPAPNQSLPAPNQSLPTPNQTVPTPNQTVPTQDSPGQSGSVWSTTLPNGAEVSGLGGSITPGEHGGGDLRGHLLSLDRDGMHVGVVEGRLGGAAEISQERVNLSARAELTGINASTGNNNTFDIGSKIGDIGGEATVHVEADGSAGRIGAGYRANVAEVNGGIGSVSNESTSDFRQEARVSVGAPSGGVFVSWGDRDNDKATNYRLDVDVPIPGTPLGVGVSYETEKPIQDGLGVLATLNPITAPIAGGYMLGRALKFW